MTDQLLISRAIQAMKNAYAPYSNFSVGAALLCDSGNVYAGCNVESSAFGVSICAERGAISAAVSGGDRSFTTLAVIGSVDSFCTPCGICRQILFEFSPNCRVLCCKSDGTYEIHTARELLPFPFSL
jgi:cytidine deaminase